MQNILRLHLFANYQFSALVMNWIKKLKHYGPTPTMKVATLMYFYRANPTVIQSK